MLKTAILRVARACAVAVVGVTASSLPMFAATHDVDFRLASLRCEKEKLRQRVGQISLVGAVRGRMLLIGTEPGCSVEDGFTGCCGSASDRDFHLRRLREHTLCGLRGPEE